MSLKKKWDKEEELANSTGKTQIFVHISPLKQHLISTCDERLKPESKSRYQFDI